MPILSEKELGLYADDVLVKTLRRTRYGSEVREALAAHIGRIVDEAIRGFNHAEARKAISVEKPTK
ncbi:hypothetical protein [Caudoviricetes sp.]|nr:hypothetical protein [Caudoviricetes sp.]